MKNPDPRHRWSGRGIAEIYSERRVHRNMTGHRYKDTKHNEDILHFTILHFAAQLRTPPSLSIIISVTRWIGAPTNRLTLQKIHELYKQTRNVQSMYLIITFTSLLSIISS